MTYETHFRTALDAFARVRPDVSDRRLSIAAGLNAGWIAEFRASGSATFACSQRVLRAMLEFCGDDARGDDLRRIVAKLHADPQPVVGEP